VQLPRLRVPREVLGISADIFGTAAGIAIVGPVIVGIVAGQLAPALIAALMTALLVVVYLLSRLRRITRDNKRLRHEKASNGARIAAMHANTEIVLGEYRRASNTLDNLRDILSRATAEAVAGDPDQDDGEDVPIALGAGTPAHDPEASQWLADPADLMTFALTPADLEALYGDAVQRAVADIGPDAVVRLDSVILFCNILGRLPRTPRVQFYAVSDLSMKRMHIEYQGNSESVSSATFPRTIAPPKRALPQVKQWQTDPNYTDLVLQSWRRMRQFTGIVTLEAYSKPFLDTRARWLAVYVSTAEHDAGQARLFTISDGKLSEVMPGPG